MLSKRKTVTHILLHNSIRECNYTSCLTEMLSLLSFTKLPQQLLEDKDED